MRVAVLDTGVNQHAHGVAEDRIKVREDVLAQQSTAPGELAGVVTGTEGELVGKVANWIFDGFDFDPMSSASHATAVASVIAAGGDEELRKQNVDEWWSKSKMVGVAPDAEIISVRVMEGPVHIGDNDVDDGIKKAVEHDADVISMSLGGFGFKGLRQEIDDAVEKGKIVVCATGNAFNVVVEPASYGTTIGVTSFDSDRKPFEEQASRGPSADVAAPGHLVHRATFTGADDVQEVEPSTGTTYATAHVAGVAALWLGKHGVENLRTFYPKIKLPQLFKHALKATTDPWDDRDLQADWGTGRVNVKKLLDFEIFKRDANGQPIGAAVADDALNKAFVEIDFLAPQDQVLGGIAAVFTGKGTVNTREGLVGAAQSIPGLLAAEVASSPPSDEQFRKGVATGNPADLPVPAGASSELQTVIAEASDDGRRAAELKLNTTPLNPEWGAGLSKPLRRALEGRADPVKGRRWWGVVALVVAILVALLAGEARDFLGRAAGISGLLAFLTVGVYAFAQGIERLLEWTLARAVYRDVPGREPDRALILLGAGVLLGTVGSVVLDIGLLASVGDLTDAAGMQLTEGTGADKMEVGSDPLFERADALVTGLAVGGGAKPIHDLLTRIRLPLGT